jgi:hypothetical protein
METMYYIGLDVHKKTISYCVKDGSGRIYAEAEIPATRLDLDMRMKTFPQPWTAAMEATIFTSWIYDHLLPHATAVKVAHPLMLRAIAAARGSLQDAPACVAGRVGIDPIVEAIRTLKERKRFRDGF